MSRQLVFPMVLYVFYILGLGFLNFIVRRDALVGKKIQFKYLQSFSGSDVPERVIVVGRHFDHQFQVPILFFVLCVAHMVIGRANAFTITLAWLFVATRFGHSYIHLGRNDVIKRVYWFAAGLLITLVLAVQLAYFASTSKKSGGTTITIPNVDFD